jgi:hypothetical protein
MATLSLASFRIQFHSVDCYGSELKRILIVGS